MSLSVMPGPHWLIPCHVHRGGYSTHLLCPRSATFKLQPSYHCIFSLPFSPTVVNEHTIAFSFSFFTHSLTLLSSRWDTSQNLHQTDATVKETRVVNKLNSVAIHTDSTNMYHSQGGPRKETQNNSPSLGEKQCKICLSC